MFFCKVILFCVSLIFIFVFFVKSSGIKFLYLEERCCIIINVILFGEGILVKNCLIVFNFLVEVLIFIMCKFCFFIFFEDDGIVENELFFIIEFLIIFWYFLDCMLFCLF